MSEASNRDSGTFYNQHALGGCYVLGRLATRVRRLFKSARLKDEAPCVAERCYKVSGRRTFDEKTLMIHNQQANSHTDVAEAANLPGIYVYALPHYLRYPYDAESGRTLMMVGCSGSDITGEFRVQARTIAPEEPVLLRIYGCPQSEALITKAQFCRRLSAADHLTSTDTTGRHGWFVTSTGFLDVVAETLSLRIIIVNEASADDVRVK